MELRYKQGPGQQEVVRVYGTLLLVHSTYDSYRKSVPEARTGNRQLFQELTEVQV